MADGSADASRRSGATSRLDYQQVPVDEQVDDLGTTGQGAGAFQVNSAQGREPRGVASPGSRRRAEATQRQQAATGSSALAGARRAPRREGAEGGGDDIVGSGYQGSVVQWLLPGLVLLVGLFAHNCGLYLGTRNYVRWMDTRQQPLPHTPGTINALWREVSDKFALEDVFSAVFPDAGTNTPVVHYAIIFDKGAICIPMFWLGWVTRTRDLRMWTHMCLCAALLLTFKGVLACTTVLPDAEGWGACQDRLGMDGLTYYRQQAEAASIDGGAAVYTTIWDTLLLLVRGLWLAGKEQREHLCADTVLCSTTCLYTLFCASLFEHGGKMAEHLSGYVQTAVRVALKSVLGAMLLCTGALPIVGHQHYTADVAFAFVLAPLLYSSPAIAVAVERWVAGALPEGDEADWGESPTRSTQKPLLANVRGNSSVSDGSPGSAGIGTEHKPLWMVSEEVGKVELPPGSTPFCWPEGPHYLRRAPIRLQPAEAHNEELWQQELQNFHEIREQQRAQLRQLKEALRKAKADAASPN